MRDNGERRSTPGVLLTLAAASLAMSTSFHAHAAEPVSANPYGILDPDDFKHPAEPAKPAILSPPSTDAIATPPSTQVPAPTSTTPLPADVGGPSTPTSAHASPMTPVVDPGTRPAASAPASLDGNPVVPGASSPTATWTPSGKAMSPSLTPAQATERRWLSERADEALKRGDVIAARAFLDPPATAGDPDALVLLAQTYDPAMLSKWGVVGVPGDPAKAGDLYKRAQEAGSAATAVPR